MITFESALDAVSQLSIDQQEILIDILRKRNAEVRRQQILEKCREGLIEYRSGVLTAQTGEEAIADLRSYVQS
ncbi:hypothetical protein H6F44_04030 [Pseudanabaena sp. FACHB-1277]|jgi:hypothetical protein|uniref:Uncharacterized protein n=1 Tax=Pseudanabaena cinerea FACHB-1277 TaxID=2949581 RepID=A0A926UQM4_9CYAN|nr:hypothetical protein [Pseudanabaena cinerea]MBD2149294.1 hypothetical protein [Pseudanabaena cinerea FACHB-1277]